MKPPQSSPSGTRRANQLSAALAAGIVLNGLRLGQRLRALATLDPAEPPADADPPASARTFAWLVLDGVTVDEATRRAAVAHAERHGLDVLDLIPADLPVEQALEIVRRVDPASYRESRLHPGFGAYQAILATTDVLERCGLASGTGRTPLEMLTATDKLKFHAATSTDLAVAPDLSAAPIDPTADGEFVEERFGRAIPLLASLPLAHQAMLSRGARRRSAAGLAALALHGLQPHAAFAGTALHPRDLTPAQPFGRLAKQSRSTWKLLAANKWTGEDAAKREVAQKRPFYDALLADGLAKFFEPPRTDCPLCGSVDLRHRVRVGDLIQGKPGSFQLDECNDCRHVFQNPRLSIEGLDFYYGDFYDGIGAKNAEMLFASNDKPYLGRARMLRGHAEPRRWLDVGGGHGHFTLIAAGVWPKTTFDLLDMSDSVDEARRRNWISTGYRGLFPDFAEELAGAYDVVSMHHYLEHTRDPMAELDTAHRVLEPGGHLLIEVPNPDDIISRPLGWLWGPWFQPQHQHFVSLGNLTRELEQRGFTVVETHVSESHQATDLAFAAWLLANRLAPSPPMPWVPPLTAAQKLGRIAAFTAMAPFIAAGLVLDQVIAPISRRIPGRSNTYRVLARRD